jgi:transcription elongation factor
MSHRKRKRSSEREPAALFDVEQVKFVYGADSVEKWNQVYCFKKDIYKNSLLEKDVHPTDLSYSNVLRATTQPELDIFRRSGDELVIKALDAGVVPLQIGDRIQVITGTFRGLAGHLVDIHNNNTVDVESDIDVMETTSRGALRRHFQVCSSEVRKKFGLGDYVQVLHGAHTGDEGYIVELSGSDATIYKRCVVFGKYATHEEPGVEVSF